jgi:dihydroorotase
MLTDAAVATYDTNMKMNPPLRSEDHRKRFSKPSATVRLTPIATDHAPHHADEKALEFDHAPFGITGLETAVGLALTHLVHPGIIDLARLVELCSVNPARIFQLADRGTLRPGAHADITILDPDLRWTFDVRNSKSKSRNTPFDGTEMHGAAVATNRWRACGL